ncbi:hypothetical protein ATANTOWER_026248, partial [Ataeniobius toweri]|nr:hypothetical protein [Ataeniobius toweri]
LLTTFLLTGFPLLPGPLGITLVLVNDPGSISRLLRLLRPWICQPKPVLTSSCLDSLCSPGPLTSGLFRTSWFSPSFCSDHYPTVETFPGRREVVPGF